MITLTYAQIGMMMLGSSLMGIGVVVIFDEIIKDED